MIYKYEVTIVNTQNFKEAFISLSPRLVKKADTGQDKNYTFQEILYRSMPKVINIRKVIEKNVR